MTYNPAFDGIRALAVLAVVAFHCRVPGLPGGFIGVDIFFVLSGYLITTILRREIEGSGTVRLAGFYALRALRLIPALLLLLAVYSVVGPAFLPVDPIVDMLLVGLYLSDYSIAFWRQPIYLGHTWSLAVEEHFYLVWPLILLAAARLQQRTLVVVLLGAFVAVTLWRWFDLVIWVDWYRTYYRFDTRASGLILGCALAITPLKLTASAANRLGIASVAVLALLMATLQFRTPWPLLFGGMLVEIAAAGLILSVAHGEGGALRRLLAWRPLVGVGVISYSIYLWHYPIVRVLRDSFDPWAQFWIAAPLSIAIASLSYLAVERPVRAWGRARLEARRRSASEKPALNVQ